MPENLTPFEEFWMDDGSVVVIAENRTFRVHRSVLVRHSEVFRDMFALAQPGTSASDTIDGCPFVHVSDSAEDFAHLLRPLYAGGDGPYFKTDVALPFDTVAAMLRSGSKYQVPQIKEEALRRLKRAYSSTLQEWDHRPGRQEAEITAMCSNDKPLRVLHLARTLNLQDLLPAALYLSCQLPMSDYFSNAGKDQFPSAEDMCACMEGKVVLHQVHTLALGRVLSSGIGRGCQNKTECEKNLNDGVASLRGYRGKMPSSTSRPLASLLNALVTPTTGRLWFPAGWRLSVCQGCYKSLMEVLQEEREGIWKYLAGIFEKTKTDVK